jgi:hypothetical protein
MTLEQQIDFLVAQIREAWTISDGVRPKARLEGRGASAARQARPSSLGARRPPLARSTPCAQEMKEPPT